MRAIPKGLALAGVLSITTGGCGGRAREPAPLPLPAARSAQPISQDLRIELPEIRISSAALIPRYLRLPELGEPSRRRRPLAQLRQRANRRRAREGEQVELAEALWREAFELDQSEPERAAELRGEAYERMLRALGNSGEWPEGKSASARALRMRVLVESWAGNRADALAWLELWAASGAEQGSEARAHLALEHLAEGRIRPAAKLIRRSRDEAHRSVHWFYADAWLAFTRHESERFDRALEALQQGVEAEGASYPAAAILRELEELRAHRGASLSEAQSPDERRQHARLLFEAGRWRESQRAMRGLREEALDAPWPLEQRLALRRDEAKAAFALLDLDAVVQAWVSGVDILVHCGAGCDAAVAQDYRARVSSAGQALHTLYSASYDEAQYRAARELYQAALRLGGPESDALRTYLRDLENFFHNASSDKSLHSDEAMAIIVHAHAADAASCHRANRPGTVLEGDLTLLLDVAANGTVSGATTQPAPGLEGLSRVAACLVERARGWRFPSREIPGSTVVVVPYAFRAPEAP